MTATRIGVATLAALWLVAGLLLWRTEVPAGLELREPPSVSRVVDVDRGERHDRVLRALALASLAAQLAALALLAWRRPPVRGRPLLRAAQLGAIAALALFLARLPIGLAALWWQRRYGIVQLGYGGWLLDRLGPLGLRVGLLAGAAALCVALARWLGRRWWIAATPVLALVGAAVVLAQPLVSPRLEALRRPAIVRDVELLARREGLPRPDVEVRRTEKRTRQLNAEAIGIGPTTRVVLWQSTLQLPRANLRFLVAHELAHVAREHLWKGLAWYVLLLVPGLALLARLVRLDEPDYVPGVLLAAFVLVLAVTPFANTVSRRYETEADWVALETTRDPRGAAGMLERIAIAGVRDPDPPGWWTALFATHPAISQRLELTAAWARSRAEARSRAGS